MFRERFRLSIGLVSLIPLIAGCAIFSPDGGNFQEELDAHRATWNGGGITNYQVQFQRLCRFFGCNTDLIIPVRLTVRDGIITEVVDLDTDEVVTDAPSGTFLTVDQLFDSIQDAIDRDAADIDIRYDEQLGYPINVDIDINRGVFGDEAVFELRDLQPID